MSASNLRFVAIALSTAIEMSESGPRPLNFLDIGNGYPFNRMAITGDVRERLRLSRSVPMRRSGILRCCLRNQRVSLAVTRVFATLERWGQR
jgi:hypothetical protein